MGLKNQVFTNEATGRVLTVDSWWVLIDQAADHLLRVGQARRRDRWWFLGRNRVAPAESPPDGHEWSSSPSSIDVKRNVVGNQVLFERRAPGLWCVGRVVWNRGGRRHPTVLLDFRSTPRTPVGRGPGAGETVTYEVRFDAQRAPAGIFTRRSAPQLSLADRQAWWRRYLRWRRRAGRRGWETLRIEPGAPVSAEVTKMVLLLDLARREMIDLDDSPEALIFVRRFLQPGGIRDERDALEVLGKFWSTKTRYAHPERWHGFLAYLGRVNHDLRWGRLGPEIPMDAETIARLAGDPMEDETTPRLADPRRRGGAGGDGWPGSSDSEYAPWRSVGDAARSLGVRPETIYRWARRGRIRLTRQGDQAGLDAAGFGTARELLDGRTLRADVMSTLMNGHGKSRDAAKKWIQRRLQAGKKLADLKAELWRGADGEGD